MAIIVIETQFRENYGSHSWDGKGECPQYWKCKGGSSIKVRVPYDVDYEWIDIIADRAIAQHIDDLEWSDDYSQQYIMDWHVEEDGWLSGNERLQLEYDGEIIYPESELEYTEEEYA